jgi:hypothetical protein
VSTHKDLSPTNSDLNTENSVVKVAMLSMTFQNWGKSCILCEIVLPDSVIHDRQPSPSQWSPLSTQNIDFGYTSESCELSPLALPGSLPVPTIRGDTSKRETFLLANHGDSAQDSVDSTLLGLRHSAEYFIVLNSQGL